MSHPIGKNDKKTDSPLIFHKDRDSQFARYMALIMGEQTNCGKDKVAIKIKKRKITDALQRGIIDYLNMFLTINIFIIISCLYLDTKMYVVCFSCKIIHLYFDL